jgi:uncharacterized membrane protein YgcG
MNEMRLADPLIYMRKVEEVLALEATIEQGLHRLIETVKLIKAKRIDTLPSMTGTVVDPADSPTITLDEARREEDKFAGRLASSDRIEDVEEQARKVCDLYQKCAEQAATIQSAIKGAAEAIQTAKRLDEAAAQRRVTADQARIKAERVHKGCNATAFITAGDRFLEQGRKTVEKAEQQLRTSGHLNARRCADEAAETFQNADRKFEEATKHCAALDQQKQAYEEKLASMGGRYESAVSKVKRYGGRGRIQAFQRPHVDHGVVDYAILYRLLTAQESAWESEERQARHECEERERQQREADEAARQRRADEEAAERRQQSSYSSSSSTGGSWDSGSSSFGGSWGGSSSSSGGSW